MGYQKLWLRSFFMVLKNICHKNTKNTLQLNMFHQDILKKKKDGHGFKIMAPNQLLTRLPILLAQKKAENNSQKLNSEI